MATDQIQLWNQSNASNLLAGASLAEYSGQILEEFRSVQTNEHWQTLQAKYNLSTSALKFLVEFSNASNQNIQTDLALMAAFTSSEVVRVETFLKMNVSSIKNAIDFVYREFGGKIKEWAGEFSKVDSNILAVQSLNADCKSFETKIERQIKWLVDNMKQLPDDTVPRVVSFFESSSDDKFFSGEVAIRDAIVNNLKLEVLAPYEARLKKLESELSLQVSTTKKLEENFTSQNADLIKSRSEVKENKDLITQLIAKVDGQREEMDVMADQISDLKIKVSSLNPLKEKVKLLLNKWEESTKASGEAFGEIKKMCAGVVADVEQLKIMKISQEKQNLLDKLGNWDKVIQEVKAEIGTVKKQVNENISDVFKDIKKFDFTASSVDKLSKSFSSIKEQTEIVSSSIQKELGEFKEEMTRKNKVLSDSLNLFEKLARESMNEMKASKSGWEKKYEENSASMDDYIRKTVETEFNTLKSVFLQTYKSTTFTSSQSPQAKAGSDIDQSSVTRPTKIVEKKVNYCWNGKKCKKINQGCKFFHNCEKQNCESSKCKLFHKNRIQKFDEGNSEFLQVMKGMKASLDILVAATKEAKPQSSQISLN
jgi:hypothetical protein